MYNDNDNDYDNDNDNDNDNEMILYSQAYRDYALMHNYTVIIRKVIIKRKHIQRLCIVTN